MFSNRVLQVILSTHKGYIAEVSTTAIDQATDLVLEVDARCDLVLRVHNANV